MILIAKKKHDSRLYKNLELNICKILLLSDNHIRHPLVIG